MYYDINIYIYIYIYIYIHEESSFGAEVPPQGCRSTAVFAISRRPLYRENIYKGKPLIKGIPYTGKLLTKGNPL